MAQATNKGRIRTMNIGRWAGSNLAMHLKASVRASIIFSVILSGMTLAGCHEGTTTVAGKPDSGQGGFGGIGAPMPIKDGGPETLDTAIETGGSGGGPVEITDGAAVDATDLAAVDGTDGGPVDATDGALLDATDGAADSTDVTSGDQGAVDGPEAKADATDATNPEPRCAGKTCGASCAAGEVPAFCNRDGQCITGGVPNDPRCGETP